MAPSNSDKWFYSAQGGIIFAAISVPITYKLTNKVFGRILNDKGCPTIYGILIHAIVFTIIIKTMMR